MNLEKENLEKKNIEKEILQISKNIEKAKKEYLGNSYLVLVSDHRKFDNIDLIYYSIFVAKMTNIVVNNDNIIDWAKCYDGNKHKIPLNPKCYVFDISFTGIKNPVEMVEFGDDPTPLLKYIHELS